MKPQITKSKKNKSQLPWLGKLTMTIFVILSLPKGCLSNLKLNIVIYLLFICYLFVI